MTTKREASMRTRLAALTLLTLVVACGGRSEPSAERKAAVDESAIPPGPDPCSLVSQSEMESLIGPLDEPPFRVDDDRAPSVSGDGCFYRARDRRNVTIAVDWEGGEMAFQIFAGTGTAITDILSGYDASTDTLEGAWDRVGAPFGQFIALKGKTSVQIDPYGSRPATAPHPSRSQRVIGRRS